MNRRKLDRRTLLKGILGGAAVTIGLPALEMFLNRHGTAYAGEHDAEGFPRRFGIFFWGNGVHPEHFIPKTEGMDWELTEQLTPLAAFRDKISVITGMQVKVPNVEPHWATACGFLTGGPILMSGTDWTFGGETIDAFLAREIGGDSRFPSLEFGTKPGNHTVSYTGPNSPIPVEDSPAALFERVFGGSFQRPGDDPTPDPTLALQRSVLDSVMGDITRIQSIVGASDRIRLEQHFDGVRTLEKRLARLEEDPPALAACAFPPTPAGDYPDVEGRPPLQEKNAILCDIAAMALACDQTRVFMNMFTRPLVNVLFENASAGHHQLTHNEPGEQPEVRSIVLQCMTAFAYQLEALDKIEEGAGTLLDHCLVLGTTDVGEGKTHSQDEFPIILAGGASGRIRTGLHYRSPASENTSKVGLSIIRAMGVDAASWGADEGLVEEGLGAIEV